MTNLWGTKVLQVVQKTCQVLVINIMTLGYSPGESLTRIKPYTKCLRFCDTQLFKSAVVKDTSSHK